MFSSIKTLSKNASGEAKEKDEKYYEEQTAFSTKSNLGSSAYEEQFQNTEMYRPEFKRNE